MAARKPKAAVKPKEAVDKVPDQLVASKVTLKNGVKSTTLPNGLVIVES
jgi:hypothetical protein